MDKNSEKCVGIVIVTYNRKELLLESINAILSQNYDNYKLFIIDNNSTDGTEEYIKDCLNNKKITYINTQANLGGAGGFNFGIKQAVKYGCDYIWIMDDDCIVEENSLTALVNYAKNINDNFGFLSSVVRWKDNSICKMNEQRINLYSKVKDFSCNQKIELASFVSLFIKSSVVEDVGLPIKDFFIWGDDWEYTNRISKKYDCYLVPDSEVVHKSKNNLPSDIVKDEEDRLNRYFYTYRNERFLYRKNGVKGRFYYFLKILLHIKRVLFSKTNAKRKKLGIIFKGIKAGKRFNPKIEYVFNANSDVKVLQFFGEPLAYGGQEAFMVNMYKNFENNNIHYTFCTPFNSENKTLIELTKQKNDEIVAYNYEFHSKLRKKSIKKTAKDLLSKNEYDIIHIQSGSIYTLLAVAKLAKKYGVKKVIVHSHCTGNNNFKYKLIKWFSDRKIDKYVDIYFACSDLAAVWKFPKNVIENNNYVMVKNGIDIEKFTFNNNKRNKYREEFNLTNEIVLCNVGRFELQKNHEFTIKLAEQLKIANFNFKFILVGTGSLKEKMINKIKELGLENYFIILENRTDIAEIMMASDIFVLPSLFEGFPVTLIEAQASGIYSLASDLITKEAIITDICHYLSLDDVGVWVEKIKDFSNQLKNREKYAEIVSNAGYSSKQSALLLEDKYLN